MTSQVKLVVGAVIASGACVGIAAHVLLKPGLLPEPAHPASKEVFPELGLRAATVGKPLRLVYASFGKKPPDPDAQPGVRRCIYFQYDPDLYEGALVVLAGSDSVVEQRWLLKPDTKPSECAGLPEQVVDLRGWYAAAVR